MQIGFGALLFLVFLVLKLTGIIAWSWLWVTSPLWISAILFVIIFGTILVGGLFTAVKATRVIRKK